MNIEELVKTREKKEIVIIEERNIFEFKPEDYTAEELEDLVSQFIRKYGNHLQRPYTEDEHVCEVVYYNRPFTMTPDRAKIMTVKGFIDICRNNTTSIIAEKRYNGYEVYFEGQREGAY